MYLADDGVVSVARRRDDPDGIPIWCRHVARCSLDNNRPPWPPMIQSFTGPYVGQSRLRNALAGELRALPEKPPSRLRPISPPPVGT